eukprot:8912885-Pyramimonas_sp.AAC.1
MGDDLDAPGTHGAAAFGANRPPSAGLGMPLDEWLEGGGDSRPGTTVPGPRPGTAGAGDRNWPPPHSVTPRIPHIRSLLRGIVFRPLDRSTPTTSWRRVSSRTN